MKKYLLDFFKDPLSHRVIEKRRRDRMNSCLGKINFVITQGQLCPLVCLYVKIAPMKVMERAK